MARAVTVPPLDAHSDLEFSLDGTTWTDAPDLVLGSWGCDVLDGPDPSAPGGAIGGTPEVDPCSMSPGESIDRTYHVRNSSNTGRTGRYEVGIGEFLVSGEAEFDVSSDITGSGASDSGTVTIYGADTPQAADSPPRGSTLAGLDLGPGQSAIVVDQVSVPLDVENYAQRQSVSPMIWVTFSDIGVVDTDGDGLPDLDENQLGTDPLDPFNRLPGGTVGKGYGPEQFLPTTPPGTVLDVDLDTLPPGMRLENGVLKGTPTEAGTFDIEFTVTMPGGASYTSIRRVVIEPRSGGGSSDLPDFIWPIVIIGGIGVIVGILAPYLGSLAGSLGGSPGGPGSGGSAGSGSLPGATTTTSTTPAPRPSDPAGGTAGGGTTQGGGTGGTGQVAVNSVTPREGAPSEDWTRANSQVRGSLAETGVGVVDLLLWAHTAAAAGVTLILLARRRREHAED